MGEPTTAGTGQAQTFTLADLERVEQMLSSMPRPPWVLIAPDGRAWQDIDPRALIRVLTWFVAGDLVFQGGTGSLPSGVEGKKNG